MITPDSFSPERPFIVLTDVPIRDMSLEMNHLATQLGKDPSESGLLGFGDPQELGIHGETIYAAKMCRFFMLGCIQPAVVGGESLVFDAVSAAEVVRNEYPELSDVKIEFNAESSGAGKMTRPLLSSGVGSETFLCYRQFYGPDVLSGLPTNISREQFHYVLDEIVQEHTIYDRKLEKGEIIIVDNLRTLHGRRSFEGFRKMLRLRLNDI